MAPFSCCVPTNSFCKLTSRCASLAGSQLNRKERDPADKKTVQTPKQCRFLRLQTRRHKKSRTSTLPSLSESTPSLHSLRKALSPEHLETQSLPWHPSWSFTFKGVTWHSLKLSATRITRPKKAAAAQQMPATPKQLPTPKRTAQPSSNATPKQTNAASPAVRQTALAHRNKDGSLYKHASAPGALPARQQPSEAQQLRGLPTRAAAFAIPGEQGFIVHLGSWALAYDECGVHIRPLGSCMLGCAGDSAVMV